MLLIIEQNSSLGGSLLKCGGSGDDDRFAFKLLFLRDHLTLGDSRDLGGRRQGPTSLDLPQVEVVKVGSGASLCRPDSPSDSCWTRWRRLSSRRSQNRIFMVQGPEARC